MSGNTISRAFAQKVVPTGSLDLKFGPDDNGHINKHTPDLTFSHKHAVWPGVVIEVGYSQSPKNLVRLAWDYISDSDGGIQVVICLELHYKDKGANLSVWRPVVTTGDDGIDDLDCVRTVHQASIYSPPFVLRKLTYD